MAKMDVVFVHAGERLVLLRVQLSKGTAVSVKILPDRVVVDKEEIVLPGRCIAEDSYYEVDEVAQLLTVSLVPETVAGDWKFKESQTVASVDEAVWPWMDVAEVAAVRAWAAVVAAAQRYWLCSPHWLSILLAGVYVAAAWGLTSLLWGDRSFSGALFVFQKVFGLVFLLAWLSVASQIRGLCGREGIVPCERDPQAGHVSLLSSRPSDSELMWCCGAGVASCTAFMLNLFPSAAMAACTLLYLSIRNAGTVFFRLQFDSLLIEAGWIAVLTFLAPLRWTGFDFGDDATVCPRVGLFLLQFLMLRVLFSSGVVKLTSRDKSWANCSALEYHYFSQPLPLRLGMLMHRLPRALNRASCFMHFVLELAVPLGFFVPPLRAVACVGSLGLQAMIALTGHYGFFNLCSAALCLTSLDDSWLPAWLVTPGPAVQPGAVLRAAGMVWNLAASIVAGAYVGVVLICSLVPLGNTGKGCGALTGPMAAMAAAVAPFYRQHLARWGCLNAYGLFAVMTTRRQEVIVEGSMDGREWRAYELAHKPGNPLRSIPWTIAPGHLPRLQWWLWFCPFGEPEPWAVALQQRLLEGAPNVLNLFDVVPFDCPTYVRMTLYDYRFATAEEQRRTGHFWVRKAGAPFLSARSK
jgi:hypothetical protein